MKINPKHYGRALAWMIRTEGGNDWGMTHWACASKYDRNALIEDKNTVPIEVVLVPFSDYRKLTRSRSRRKKGRKA